MSKFHDPEFRHFIAEAGAADSPFGVMAADRKLTDEELIRAVRFSISSEYEAIKQYMQIAESTDNEEAKRLMTDIADEERVHVGEFLSLLKRLDPKEAEFYEKGEKEAEGK